MRLSQPYKSPNISGSDGEQTKGKKEEEEGGLRRLTQALVVLKHKGKDEEGQSGDGWGKM